jgi:hypothetical protein
MKRENLSNRFWAPAVAIVAAGLLCGCSTGAGNFLSRVSAASEEFSGDYQQVADCAYREFSADIYSTFKKYNNPSTKTVRIAADGNGVRYWELDIRETGPEKVSASLNLVSTNWAPDAPSRDVMPAVRACASVDSGVGAAKP